MPVVVELEVGKEELAAQKRRCREVVEEQRKRCREAVEEQAVLWRGKMEDFCSVAREREARAEERMRASQAEVVELRRRLGRVTCVSREVVVERTPTRGVAS